jgi:hypothetical protein
MLRTAVGVAEVVQALMLDGAPDVEVVARQC